MEGRGFGATADGGDGGRRARRGAAVVVLIVTAAGSHALEDVAGLVVYFDVFADGPGAVDGQYDDAERPVGIARRPGDRHNVCVGP